MKRESNLSGPEARCTRSKPQTWLHTPPRVTIFNTLYPEIERSQHFLLQAALMLARPPASVPGSIDILVPVPPHFDLSSIIHNVKKLHPLNQREEKEKKGPYTYPIKFSFLPVIEREGPGGVREGEYITITT